MPTRTCTCAASMIRCRRRFLRVTGLRTIFFGLTLVVAVRVFWIIPSSTSTSTSTGLDGDERDDPVVLMVASPNAEIKAIHNKHNNNETLASSYRHPNFRVDFPLCLVHVGKAAGSSVSCGLGLTYADCEGMPRDRLPHTHFFHMRRNNCPRSSTTTATATRTYAVTLRNPLTRLQSWFDFEKDIVPTRGKTSQAQVAQVRSQRAILFQDCYPTFERFVLEGLVPLVPVVGNNNNNSNNETVTAGNPKDMTCSERAWAAVLGVRAFSYHEWYNYEYYWTGIQPRGGFPSGPSSASPPVVYALRTEHLEQDWMTVSKEPLFRPVNRSKPKSSNNKNTTNTHTSPTFLMENTRAREQLCRALCPEIQFYKQFLLVSTNLSPTQQKESLQEVKNYCPLETSLQPRDCPGIPTFPKIRVKGRQYRTEIKKRLYEIIS